MALTHDFDHALRKELTGLQTISNFSTMLLHCLPAAPANPQTIKWIVSIEINPQTYHTSMKLVSKLFSYCW